MREKLQSRDDGPGLHAAAEALVTEGKAVRADFALLTVPDGDRVSMSSWREDPAVTDWYARIASDGGMELLPGDVMWLHHGPSIEMEARVLPDLRTVDLSFHTDRMEGLGMQRLGSGRCEYRHPVRHSDGMQFQMMLPAGTWRLAGCWDVPGALGEDYTEPVSPEFPDVMLMFVRAGVDSQRAAEEKAGPLPKECLLISEWIEVSADQAAELCAAGTDAAQMRGRLEASLAENTATLRGMAVVPLRDHQRGHSWGMFHPVMPAEFNMDAFRWQVQEQSVELDVGNAGHRFEGEVAFIPGQKQWVVRLDPEFVTLHGTIPVSRRGKDALPAGAVRSVSNNGISQHLAAPGETVLVSTSESVPVTASTSDVTARRVLMNFVRVLP